MDVILVQGTQGTPIQAAAACSRYAPHPTRYNVLKYNLPESLALTGCKLVTLHPHGPQLLNSDQCYPRIAIYRYPMPPISIKPQQ